MTEYYRIGPYVWRFESDFSFTAPRHVAHFCIEGEPKYDFMLTVQQNKIQCCEQGQVLYDNQQWLRVIQYPGERYIFHLPSDERCCVSSVLIDSLNKSCIFQIDASQLYADSTHILETTPFLMCNMIFLANEGGIILHSCAASIHEDGYLFCGASGAGKTTISRLLNSREDIQIITDETVLLHQERNGEFIISGSPWKGSGADFYKNKSVKLKAIFFISHGNNTIEAISKKDAVHILFKQAFPAFWDKRMLLKNFATIDRLTETVPTMTFSFKPDESCVKKVLVYDENGCFI